MESETEGDSPMVKVRNAWKTYDKKNYVLRDMSMTVPKGRIYSLLGSSGVGKTTLLSTICGNLVLDAGQIEVDISSRLQIGYMPQELALYSELSLRETFKIFGMTFFMSNKEVETRVEHLTHLLHLPHHDTQLCYLSGGQQRRVSLAVALLKNPMFLILDEPTASLDALLKESIWNYLHKISREEGTSILLTTHYIEEATNSDVVAFMSKGQILLEGSPEEVTQTAGPSLPLSFEEVYYNLCYKNETSNALTEFPKKHAPVKRLYENFTSFSSRRLVAFILKSAYYVKRNLLVFYLFLLAPIMVTFIMKGVTRKPTDLKLGYVNFENNCSNTYFNCTSPLSCRFLDNVRKKHFQLMEYPSVEDGKEAVRKNYIWGMMRFSHNFSEGVVNRLDYFYASEHVDVSDEDEARVWLDMSSNPIGNMLKKNLYDSYMDSIQDWYTDCGWNARSAHPILRMEKPVIGEVVENLATSIIPVCSLVMMIATGLGLGLIMIVPEKELGTLERYRVSGLRMSELMLSGFLFSFICLLGLGTVELLVLYLYADSKGPVLWSLLAVIFESTIGILSGLLIAMFTEDLGKAMQFMMNLICSLTYTSGMIWPIEGGNWLTKGLYTLLPGSLLFGSMDRMANRGSDITDPLVYQGFISSVIWTIVLFSLVIVFSQRYDNR